MSQVVLVTGASTGFGRLLCPALQKAGHRPIASMRGAGSRNAPHAEALRDAGTDVVEIDVTGDDSVLRGVSEALRLAGRIDVLVNNAGFGMSGPLAGATTEDLKALYETNVFGAHRMVRAVLPSMRDRGSGLLVHVSSGAGRLSFPGSGTYCSSKWALEAIGEALRYELAPVGIDSVIVEPGRYDTDFHGRSLHQVSDSQRVRAYKWLRDGLRRRMRMLPAGDASDVVDAIVALIETPRGERPTRVVVRPEGTGPLAELNALQSRIMRDVLAMYGDPDVLSNGV